jgi:glycosyltransferase involved in cell wall biosynthesis
MTEMLESKPITVRTSEGPTVTVIIPVYNTAAYISETLDSVFAQTFTDFEVIVINDGSPDTDILEKAIEPYLGRIVYLKQKNCGPSAARNAGIGCARGEYIAFLDSDDSWLPQYLSEQIKSLANSGELNMVYSDALLFGDSPLSGKSYFQAYPPKSPINFENLLKGCSVFTSYVVVRKQVMFEVGLFDEDLRLLEDVDLWLRIAHHDGRIACNKQILARHRYRPRSLSHVTNREMGEAQLRVMKKLEASLDLPADERSALDREIKHIQTELETEQGKRFLLSGDFHHAGNLLTKVNIHHPSTKLQLALFGLRVAPHLTWFMAKLWQRVLYTAKKTGMVRSGERFVDDNQ